MSAPPLGPSELGGAFCLYQRTQVLFPFRRRGRRAAGASFPPPQPEPTGFNYKRPAKPSAPPPPGALPWADKHREARLQGPRERSPSPLPAIPGRAGLQPLALASRSAFGAASIRGGMETRECAWARARRMRGCGTSFQAPDLAQGSSSSKTKFSSRRAKTFRLSTSECQRLGEAVKHL